MDTATKTKAAHDAISAGAMSPNEARLKYFGLGPVPGGDTPYLQQQYYSLEALSMRDLSAPAPATAPPVVAPADVTATEVETP
jgi:phage portal protein BeeE